MPYPSWLSPRAHGLSPLAAEVLPVLYQHRLLSLRQLHRLLTAHRKRPEYLRTQLARLRELGLATATVRHRSGQGELLWYVTGLGAEVVEASGEVAVRTHRMSDQAAASLLQEHTLAVNDVGVAFVEAARRLGHECGPLDWEPERAHRVRDGDRHGDDAVVIADAVLSYIHQHADRRRVLTYFIEVDRHTETVVRLASKLRGYARYLTYIPTPPPGRGRPSRPAHGEAWRDRYTTFPRLLVVLDGKTPAALERRTADLRAIAQADLRLRHVADRLISGVTTLELLQTRGPWDRVITPIFGDPTPTDALLQLDGQTRAA
ncbi:replication-relaxation family protein [Streptantibioticus ferralitis]|uniref:Replication-relaxation family protein n=1 Tax=Streptantibioticus ferralitis TaxID=236510 RepID=A0ABT5Z787_9ACTN|nr:replication-relaxation family protein [Streptantibioticus ferralitis]MDF2259692.1 replication-relaxation family protein [Streptantibioticus ferralitis]